MLDSALVGRMFQVSNSLVILRIDRGPGFLIYQIYRIYLIYQIDHLFRVSRLRGMSMSADEGAAKKKAIERYIDSGDVFRFNTLRLFADQPRCGEEIISFFEANGGPPPLTMLPAMGSGPNVVYPHLRQLMSEGYLELHLSGGNRIYALTDHGREFLKQVPPGKFEATFLDMMDIWHERDQIDESLAALQDAIDVWCWKRRDGAPLFKVLAEATIAVQNLAR